MSIYRCAACGRINRVNSKGAGTPTCGQCKSALDTSGRPQDVNSQEFKKAIRTSPIPVLLDVWAPWCGPCRMVAPILEEVGTERAGELLILKVNSDDNQDLTGPMQLRGIPALLLFRDGKEAARQLGALPKPRLDSWLGRQGVPK